MDVSCGASFEHFRRSGVMSQYISMESFLLLKSHEYFSLFAGSCTLHKSAQIKTNNWQRAKSQA
jgi:hypothetical protein